MGRGKKLFHTVGCVSKLLLRSRRYLHSHSGQEGCLRGREVQNRPAKAAKALLYRSAVFFQLWYWGSIPAP